MEGYLTKQGHFFKTWRRRWFVLREADRTLVYSKVCPCPRPGLSAAQSCWHCVVE